MPETEGCRRNAWIIFILLGNAKRPSPSTWKQAPSSDDLSHKTSGKETGQVQRPQPPLTLVLMCRLGEDRILGRWTKPSSGCHPGAWRTSGKAQGRAREDKTGGEGCWQHTDRRVQKAMRDMARPPCLATGTSTRHLCCL